MPTIYIDREAFDILTGIQNEIKIAYSEASLSTAVRYLRNSLEAAKATQRDIRI